MRYARERGIPATARGSGVGSLVAYGLYLSHVCPLAHDLLEDWDRSWRAIVKVVPHAYAAVIARALSEGRDLRAPLPPAAGRHGFAPAAARGPGG